MQTECSPSLAPAPAQPELPRSRKARVDLPLPKSAFSWEFSFFYWRRRADQSSFGSERRLSTIKMLRTFAHSLPARNALRVNCKASSHEHGTSRKYATCSL